VVVHGVGVHLQEHIAGVTFLAFANGAPDLFSVFSAISDGPETASMAFGAAFGASLVVCTVVVATIIFVQPFQFKRRPFVRDVVLFIVAVGCTLGILTDGKVTLVEASGLVALYGIYVIVVTVSHMVYKSDYFQRVDPLRPKAAIDALKAGEDRPLIRKNEAFMATSMHISSDFGFIASAHDDAMASTRALQEPQTTPFLKALSPIDADGWSESSRVWKVVQVCRAPMLMVLMLTTPVIIAKEEATWCRSLYMLQLLIAPITVMFLTMTGGNPIGSFPNWSVALLVGAAMALSVIVLLPSDRPPVLYRWLSLTGFIVAVVWVYIIADMAVDLLSTLGTLCGVSEALIGLLVMGLGNSVGDLAANVAVARNGFPTMAASACFGAPALNMLLGIGGSYLYVIVKSGESVIFQDAVDRVQLQMSAFFLLGVLGFTSIYILCRNFYADRILGTVLVVAYAVFLATTIAVEVDQML
jgi:sodium/potassium/calcium exchanger 6